MPRLHRDGGLPRRRRWIRLLGPAAEFCERALGALEESHPYEIEAVVTYLDGIEDRDRAREAAATLGRLVRDQGLVALDPAHPETATYSPGYAPGEYHS